MGCHASKSSAVQPYLNEKAKECPGSPVHSSSSSVRDCVSHQHMFQRKKQNLGGSKTLEDLPYVRRLESLEEFRTYYSIDSKITQGPLSIVYLVRRISDKKVFAAKLICTLKEGEKSSGKRKKAKLPFARLCAEVDIHHQMRGRYFAQLEEVFYTETRRDRGFVLVMEYADLGTLRKWARNQPDASLRFGESKGRLSSGRSFLRLPPLSEHIARRILRDVLRGVEEMHEMGIVHRDIKLDNILLKDPNPRQLVAGPSFGDERLGHGGSVAKSMGKLAQNEIVLSRTWTKKKEVPRVLIVDFGLAACSEDGQYFSFCGTTSYVAPSVINGM
uniref:Protein kinase domain-containing protein n=1 Tax=Palpitomonas bilix TaxID=652834 RepID=A0A7S3G403_9EUKA|mmetsp:Transcript_27024/g.69517  ORF Transcript_27024/g.69517 Transcript_27024/m.69517 type:complete len:330 (+) Transcript_27024:163-1152(+)